MDEQKWNDLENYRDSLEHYGRKGMKWYEHIFGKEQSHAKYSKSSSGSSSNKKATKDAKREEKRQAKAEKKEADAKKKAEIAAAKKEEERKKILSKPSKLYKHRNEFTYEEIQDALKKFKWEQELSTYAKNQTSDIQRFMDTGAKFVQSMFNITVNSINLYNQAARIMNTVEGPGTWKYVEPLPKDSNQSNNQNKNQNKNQRNKKK